LANAPEGAQHISYDAEKGKWNFKVEHFTRWGADSDDSGEEEAIETIHVEQAQPKPEEQKATAFQKVAPKATASQYQPVFESQRQQVTNS